MCTVVAVRISPLMILCSNIVRRSYTLVIPIMTIVSNFSTISHLIGKNKQKIIEKASIAYMNFNHFIKSRCIE